MTKQTKKKTAKTKTKAKKAALKTKKRPPTAKKKPVVKKAGTKAKTAAKKISAKKAPADAKKKAAPKKVAVKAAPPKAAPPPKPPKEKDVPIPFSTGDYVVYPTHGVGLVTKIENQEIAGHKLKLFVISFDDDRMTLRVPVTKVTASGLRKISSRKMMDNAMITLKGRARVKRTMWSRRAQEYEAKINSGDPISIAEVVRDLHRNTDQPDQSFSERQIYEAALERLVREVAAVEKIDKEKAVEKVELLLRKAVVPVEPTPAAAPNESV